MANVRELSLRPTTFERVYEGPVDDLWALWTTKEGLEEWFAPEGCRVEVSALDVRTGGVFDHEMTVVGEDQIANMASVGRPRTTRTRARFVEVRPLERLHIRFTVDFIPGSEPHPIDLVVEFLPEGERVRMVVTAGVHPDAELTRLAAEGLASQLRGFDLALSARRSEVPQSNRGL
jgi:uncharacterized protein YndB with AHSA1/START domain